RGAPPQVGGAPAGLRRPQARRDAGAGGDSRLPASAPGQVGLARRGRPARRGAQDQRGEVRQEGPAAAFQGLDTASLSAASAQHLDRLSIWPQSPPTTCHRVRFDRSDRPSEEVRMPQVSRRQFLTTTATGLAGILAAKAPPAVGQVREVSYLCWNNFAPASDKKLAEIGQRFTKDTGIKLKIDHISHMGPQQAKYASEVQTQAGHDMVEMRMHFPWLYEPQLVDVSDVVAGLEKQYGKAISSAYECGHVKGVWRAVPQYHGMFVAAYRE